MNQRLLPPSQVWYHLPDSYRMEGSVELKRRSSRSSTQIQAIVSASSDRATMPLYENLHYKAESVSKCIQCLNAHKISSTCSEDSYPILKRNQEYSTLSNARIAPCVRPAPWYVRLPDSVNAVHLSTFIEECVPSFKFLNL